VRFNYKSYPVRIPDPAFPDDKFSWHPVLPVRLNYPQKHNTTPSFEAFVDSGSPYCYFRTDIGRALGIKIGSGAQSALGGVIEGPRSPVFFHSVGLYVGADLIRIKAGFCETLSVGGILGRNGFFDNYKVTFDQSASPPCFELQRITKE